MSEYHSVYAVKEASTASTAAPRTRNAVPDPVTIGVLCLQLAWAIRILSLDGAYKSSSTCSSRRSRASRSRCESANHRSKSHVCRASSSTSNSRHDTVSDILYTYPESLSTESPVQHWIQNIVLMLVLYSRCKVRNLFRNYTSTLYNYWNKPISATYDHRLQRIRDPVRSPIYKL
jgi:hypothetical protein